MLEKVIATLKNSLGSDAKNGYFLSFFGENQKLLASGGYLVINDTTENHIKNNFKQFDAILNTTKIIILDIVTNISEESDIGKILSTDLKHRGIAVMSADGKKTGIVLPNTEGIGDSKTALFNIKQKQGISGNSLISLFQTNRIIVE